MTDFTIPNTFIPGTKAKAQEVNENFIACKNAINSKANLNGDDTQVMNVATATSSSHAVNKAQFDGLESELIARANKNAVNFCAKSGHVNDLGAADLFTFSGVMITPKMGNGTTYSPCVTINAQGSETTISAAASIYLTPTKYNYSVPTMSADSYSGYVASASSYYSGYNTYKAFDNDTATAFRTNSTTTGWLQIQFPSAKKVSCYQYKPSSTTTYTAKSWTFEGSNDGSNWSVLHSVTGKDTSATLVKYDLTTTGTYLYYRMNITSNNGGALIEIPSLSLFHEDMTNGTVYFDETQYIFAKPDGSLYAKKCNIYSQAQRPTMLENDIWLNTSQEPLSAVKYDGSSDVEFLDVPLAAASVSSGSITAISTNPYNQNGYNVNKATFKQSFSSNGYAKLPNGLILQWGSYVASASFDTTITLPITFPGAGLFVEHTMYNTWGIGYVPRAYFISTSQIGCYSDAYNSSVNPTSTHYWFAIGY